MSQRKRRQSAPPDELRAFCTDAYPRIAGSLSLYTGDRGLAEELAQETFVRVCRDWKSVQSHPNPIAWTHTVAFNLAKSRFRRRKAQKRAIDRSGDNLRASLANAAAMPDDADVLAVREAVNALPEDQRAVVALRFYAGLSIDETAAALKIPEGTVKSRTTRAVASLRSAGLTVSEPGSATPHFGSMSSDSPSAGLSSLHSVNPQTLKLEVLT